MKRTFTIICAALVCASFTGCMLPKYSRLVPENKSARIRIWNPLYGLVEIDTRVVGDPNKLAELPVPTVTVGPGQ